MKAEKTKSGKYRARYVDHYEYDEKGNRIVRMGSVTTETEWETLMLADLYSNAHKRDGKTTVSFAVDNYIKLKTSVLSPATIRAYKSLQKNAYNDISLLRLSELTSTILQAWVSKYSATHSPKATANAYGLLMAAVGMFLPDKSFRVTLPKRTPPQLYTPTEAEVKKLLKAAAEKPRLHKALVLATYGLRRGEICALTYADIDTQTNTVSVSKDMVRSGKGKWTIKDPKTPQSVRYVQIAPDAVRLLVDDSKEPTAQVIDMHPDALSNAFRRLMDDVGLPDFRLHDLRSFSASLQHSLGIPDQYIQKTHGWKSDAMLKQVYRRTMADQESKYAKKVTKKMSLFVPKK